jgi:hypothetical protein
MQSVEPTFIKINATGFYSDREASEFIKAYKEKMAAAEKKKAAKKQAKLIKCNMK